MIGKGKWKKYLHKPIDFFTIVNTGYEMIALKGIKEFRNVSISNGTNITYNRYSQRKRKATYIQDTTFVVF